MIIKRVCLAVLVISSLLVNIPFSNADSEISVSPSSGAPGSYVTITISNWPNLDWVPTGFYLQDASGEYSQWSLQPKDPDKNWEITGTGVSREYQIHPLAREGLNLFWYGESTAEYTVERPTPPSPTLDFTVSESINLYPTTSTSTEIRLNYDTGHTSLIEIEAIDTPDYIQVTFDKTAVTPDGTGIGNVEMKARYDPEKNPNKVYPQQTSIKVQINSDGKTASKNVKLNILPAKWLIYFFVAVESSSSLQSYTVEDIIEVVSAYREFSKQDTDEEKVPNPIVISMLIDVDHDQGYLEGGKAIWFFSEEGLLERQQVLGEKNMGHPSTYNEFMEMINKKVPHKKTLLLLNGHGVGVGGTMIEANPSNRLTLPEFKQIGTSFDCIAMASCLMGQLEVYYDLRTKSDYIVASELVMRADAFSYGDILEFLFDAPEVEGRDLGNKFVDTYKYETLSLVETSKLGDLVKAVDGLGEALIIGFQSQDSGFVEGLRKSVVASSYVRSGKPYIDITDFSKEIIKNVSNEDVKSAAVKVVEASGKAILNNKVNKNEPAFPQGDATTTEFYGFSIFFWEHTTSGEAKKMYTDLENSYKATDFSKETSWLDFVKLYRSEGKDKTVTIRLKADNKLNLHVKDKLGLHVGQNPEDPSWIAESTIPGALFMELENGDEMILLPGGLEEFETIIEGNLTQNTNYEITYNLIEGENVLADETTSGILTSPGNHTIPIELGQNTISVGEPIIEMTTDDTTSGSEGIPGYPALSIIFGTVIIMIFLTKRQ